MIRLAETSVFFGSHATILLRALFGFRPSGRRAPEVTGYVLQHGSSQAALAGVEVVVMGPGALAELRFDRQAGNAG